MFQTFEGHESSVLRGEFLSRGMQIITSGGDGLLKIWNIKTSECVSTLHQHESHVWTFASEYLIYIHENLTSIFKIYMCAKKRQRGREREFTKSIDTPKYYKTIHFRGKCFK